MNRFMELPPTAEGKKLTSCNFINDFRLVYRKTEDKKYEFTGIYDPDTDCEGDNIIVPVTSVYQGTEPWTAGTPFANIPGSTGDKGYIDDGKKLVHYTWKEFAEWLGIPWKCHAKRNMFYDCYTDDPVMGEKFVCNDYLDSMGEYKEVVGGHVLPGTMPQKVSRNSVVYIIPICSHHNGVNNPHTDKFTHKNTTPGNGNGFYMRLDENTDVIVLNKYCPSK